MENRSVGVAGRLTKRTDPAGKQRQAALSSFRKTNYLPVSNELVGGFKTNSGRLFGFLQNEFPGGGPGDFGDFGGLDGFGDWLVLFAVRHRQRLELQEHFQIRLQILGEAAFVEREQAEKLRVVDERLGLDHGVLNLRVVSSDIDVRAGLCPGEDVFLKRLEAIETPVVVSETADQLAFEGVAGPVVAYEGLHEGAVGGAIVLTHDGDLRGCFVAPGLKFGFVGGWSFTGIRDA